MSAERTLFDLSGRRALVTGASRGIGLAIAEGLAASGAAVVLISHRLWQQRYGASPGMVGRDLLLDGVKRRIVGVMPPGFAFPDRSDVWMPIAFSSAQLARRDDKPAFPRQPAPPRSR